MRELADPFVVARPAGARVRTRLHVTGQDAAVLEQVGVHLGVLAGRDLARRCRDGSRSDRTSRKRQLTEGSSSRWAGAITRTSNDQWARGRKNQLAQIRQLEQSVRTINGRLAAPVGGEADVDGQRVRGYRTKSERHTKLRRRDVLAARLARLRQGRNQFRVSVVRGGRRLAKQRHNLETAGLTLDQWQDRWAAERLFICADGEADKHLGNETVRWNPDTGTLDLRLPTPLAHLTNRPGRAPIYRLACAVGFSHRGEEVAAQTADGAVRYDITYDPDRDRWYLDASWKLNPAPAPTVGQLTVGLTFAVDLNEDHVAGWAIDPAGNPVGLPVRFDVPTSGSTSHRDAQVRHLVSRILHTAKQRGCGSVTIENLNFTQAVSRDNPKQPRGRRGRRLRAKVAGIPTAKFRDRLTQMSTNTGLWIIAVDPAYTSQWGRKILPQLKRQTSGQAGLSIHDSAAVMIGRRARGHGLPSGVRTPARPPEDGLRATATPHETQPARARQRTTTREPSHGHRGRAGGAGSSKVVRGRQHRSDGTSTTEIAVADRS